MTREEKPLSLAMVSALRAVARMKDNSVVAWLILPSDDEYDDRFPPDDDLETQK